MYTADTHALLWHFQEVLALGRRRARGLSGRARRIFAAADDGREVVLIPSIVLVELTYLSERGVVPPALLDRLLADLAQTPDNYRMIPLDLTVVTHLRDIPPSAVPEMPDRIIAATAKATGTKLLSGDASMGTAGVRVVW